MTDNDIIKALEYWCERNCKAICPKNMTCGSCVVVIIKQALDLINRQQAEIERLQKFKTYFDSLYGINLEVEGWDENGNTISFDEFYDSAIEDMDSAEHHISYIIKCVKSEAIKEFEKRFEKKIKDVKFTIGQTWEIQYALKQTLKEMTEVSE